MGARACGWMKRPGPVAPVAAAFSLRGASGLKDVVGFEAVKLRVAQNCKKKLPKTLVSEGIERASE